MTHSSPVVLTQVPEYVEISTEYFSLDMGHLSVQPEVTLWSLLDHCFARFKAVFNFDDRAGVLQGCTALHRILDSIFDTESRAFVTEDSLPILSRLDDQAKACLLAQAIGGMILIFRRLSQAGFELSPGHFSRELQLFAESEQRRSLLAKVESSPVLGSCYLNSQVSAMITSAMEGCGQTDEEALPLRTIGEDIFRDDAAWVSDRPCKNMGMPWGFTIMAVN